MRRPSLAFALLLVVAGLSTGVTASPQPTPVCGVCGGGMVLAADETDTLRGLTVTQSVVTVRVHPDGSATWEVTTRISNDSAIASLNDRPEAVDRLVRDALRYSTIERPFQNISASIDGAAIQVRFDDPDAARRMPGDVLVVEYFHTRGYDAWPVLTADRFTVVGPEGTAVTNTPPGARVDGRTATWDGNASVPLYDAPRVEEDAYIAFTEDGPAAGLWTRLDIAIATAPIVLSVLGGIHLPALVVLAIGLVAVTAAGRRVLRSPFLSNHRAVAAGVSVLGVVGLATIALGAVSPVFNDNRWALELGAVFAAVGGLAYWRGPETRLRDLLAAGVAVQVAVVLALWATLPGEYVTQAEAFDQGLRDAVRLSPLLAMVVLGATISDGGRQRTLLGLATVLGTFFIAELSVVWPTQRPFGLVIVLFAAGAVGVVLLGSPLLVLGSVTRRDAAPEDQSASPPTDVDTRAE